MCHKVHHTISYFLLNTGKKMRDDLCNTMTMRSVLKKMRDEDTKVLKPYKSFENYSTVLMKQCEDSIKRP